MTKKINIPAHYDDEEKALMAIIESDGFEPKSVMTPEKLAYHMGAARNTINSASEKVSLRISKHDLSRVKAKALRAGIPYQTLIKSIIHQAVN